MEYAFMYCPKCKIYIDFDSVDAEESGYNEAQNEYWQKWWCLKCETSFRHVYKFNRVELIDDLGEVINENT